MTKIKLPHNYVPRDYQLPILQALDSGVKRALWCVHRRAGKDLTIWNWIIKRLNEKKAICFYIFPTYSQAKKVIWNSQTKDGISFLDFIPKELIAKKSQSDLSIFFKNGSMLQLIGSDNTDRIVGTAPTLCVFSEAALQNSTAWDLIRPILTENEGTAIFISTPRGKNWFYDLYNMAKINDHWFCEKLSIDDTNAISKEVVEEEIKAGMSEELAKQEFYVSFISLEGSYYIKYMDQMRLDGRIGNVPYDQSAKVHTAWDLGVNDPSCIIYFQMIQNEIHIIDSYEKNNEGMHHYAKELQDKPYIYGKHFAPHDIANREFGTGLSRLSIASSLGVSFEILPTLKMTKADGIEIARGQFPRIWIDEKKNQKLIKSLENYRREFDDRNNVYKNKPVHDAFSHFADSFRYMCIGAKNLSGGSMSKEKLDQLKREVFNVF